MGINASNMKRRFENDNTSFDDDINFDFTISNDLLIDILSFVPGKDLLKNCRLVSKLWKDIIDGHSVWKIKCLRENKNLPSIKLEKIPLHYYRQIYFHNPYGTNLLKNGCGENNLNEWKLVRNSGDGFIVENPPKGADPVPSKVGFTSCFATSFGHCEKYQLIDLLDWGIHPDVLELKTTKIKIGEWYAARFDCASIYKLIVVLLNNKFDKINYTLNFEECKVADFEFEYREEQWVGKEWHEVSHTFENVSNVRFVYFQHFGKDCQYWAGHYGSKMTGAFVKVVV